MVTDDINILQTYNDAVCALLLQRETKVVCGGN